MAMVEEAIADLLRQECEAMQEALQHSEESCRVAHVQRSHALGLAATVTPEARVARQELAIARATAKRTSEHQEAEVQLLRLEVMDLEDLRRERAELREELEEGLRRR